MTGKGIHSIEVTSRGICIQPITSIESIAIEITHKFKVGDKVRVPHRPIDYTIATIDYGTGKCSLSRPIIRGLTFADISDLTLIPE
jgi:hypothetical protein